MFSGIIEELGQIEKISRQEKVTLFEIRASKVLDDTKIGDSICVNGTCLTVVKKQEGTLCFEVMAQTLKVTNLGRLRIGEKLNLERALKLGDRLSGHFVSGHVDCLGIIREKRYRGDDLCLEIAIPAKFMGYIVPRGSIAIDGISLTIVEKKSDSFSTYIIPHTLQNTTLGFKGPSDKVNIEFDLLLKRNPLPQQVNIT